MIEGADGWPEVWAQFAANLRRGWSWSGFERSAFFLNDGSGTFQDIANVIGTDQVSDGRALAVGDIDGDGDLDLVGSSSRTHPHVYVLRNELATDAHFVHVELQPSGARSAAGARILLDSGGRSQRRDVALGSGFLSQHDLTQHFGLGDEDTIDAIHVRWPDGSTASYTQPPIDCRIVLRQDRSEVTRVQLQPRRCASDTPAPGVEWDSAPSSIRLLEGPPVSLAKAQVIDTQGQVVRFVAREDGPPLTLVNLWASWCSNCKHEISDLNALGRDLAGSVRVLGLSLDDADVDVAGTASDWGMAYPVAHVRGRARSYVERVLRRRLFTGARGLSLPASLVLDASGDVIAVVEGRVQPETLRYYLESLPKQ